MATFTSEELLPFFGFSGDATVSEVPPINGASNIVRTSEGWRVTFNWKTTGALNYLMSGNWKLQVLLEQMGAGEANLPTGSVTVPFVSAPNNYSKTIDFAAGSVGAGLYRVTVIITMTGAGGQPGPIAGFADLGFVQFFDSAI